MIMITPDYWYCDDLQNASFMERVEQWDEILEMKYHIQIPIMDEHTCNTLNVLLYLVIISGAFGTLVNFIICCAYALKYLKDSSMFSQSDVLISSMGVLDFVSAMMLMVGTSLFANQPTNVHNSLVEVSCTFIYAGYTLGSRTTYLMMLLIAVTRYVALCRPQDYYTWFSRPKLNFYLALLLAVSLGQMSVQQLVSCHLPMSWFNLLGGDSLAEKVERSHAHYNMFKQLWQINAFEKFGLVILTLSIITTLYIKIINHINFVTPTQLANSDDAAQMRSIRRTFIIYLVYLYLIMFPQTGMELFFTYEFLTQHDTA
ncbi:uncharacterized protein LOC134839845 [Symsagittifera roscoffensis]|uniref:uncharacterized protein LOC134839845 n=1 Tax=Symsagittifera roscoffensis TaxID=84072 RepID=UPI00307C3F20